MPKSLTKEGMVKRDIKYYLKLKGWFVFPVVQGFGSYPGVPDLIAVKERVLFIEGKAEGGRLSEGQKKFGSDIKDHKGEYLVIHSIQELIDLGI